MRITEIALLAALALPAPVLAQEMSPQMRSEAERIAALGFGELDSDKNGQGDLREMVDYSDQIFAAMDVDSSGAVDYAAFSAFDFGLKNVAGMRDRQQSYDSVLRLLFDLWDTDNDNKVSANEYRNGILKAFEASDRNADGMLTEQEYLDNFLYNIAVRAALGGF